MAAVSSGLVPEIDTDDGLNGGRKRLGSELLLIQRGGPRMRPARQLRVGIGTSVSMGACTAAEAPARVVAQMNPAMCWMMGKSTRGVG